MKTIKITTLLAVSLICLIFLLAGCSSSKEDIDAALEVCKRNGGLKKYSIGHTAVCANGAIFSNPTFSAKQMKLFHKDHNGD